MRVLVCGGRDFTDRFYVYSWLDKLFAPSYGDGPEAQPWWLPRPDLFLVLGGARGVDTIAEDWAVVNWVNHKVYPADWAKYGKAAGAIRNQQMLDEGNPTLVVAFPGGRGTADMVRRATEARLAVTLIPAPEAVSVVREEQGKEG